MIALFIVLLSAGLFWPVWHAQAGLIGSNSQTLGLAPNSPNPATAIGGSEITITGGALLPDSGVIGTMADVEDKPKSDQISLYVVREGDSLSQIAEMFSVSVNTIAWANDFERGATIRPGQMLLILPVSGIRHTVAEGETVRSIAKKYQGDAEEIIQFNGLDAEGILAKGDVVTIPGGAHSVAPSSKKVYAEVRGSNGPSYAGYYIRPIVGGVRSQGLHGHNAIDLAAPAGTPIMAAASGQVIVSRSGGWNGGYGNYVVIRHDNDTQTLYAHNTSNTVGVGQRVVQGQVIGYMGSTGRSTGNHVHFEIRGAKNPF
ncbi:MAG: M23 family metallopeptidase [Patescibacteria group bacterium]|nr:M23 family metallopeptidase [Patescibacteria group bacterium]